MAPIAALVVTAAVGCGKKADAPPERKDTASVFGVPMVGIPTPAPDPTRLFGTFAPADAIEPPSRDVVPGMIMADLIARGVIKQNDRGAWISASDPNIAAEPDETNQIVMSVEVRYGLDELAALKSRWGREQAPDSWVGVNWSVYLSCDSSRCLGNFNRRELAMFTRSLAAPGPLSRVQTGMTVDEANAAIGLKFGDQSIYLGERGPEIHLAPSGYFDNLVEGVTITLLQTTARDARRTLTKLWGEPTKLGDATVWMDPQAHRVVELVPNSDLTPNVDGTQTELELYEYVPLAKVLAKSGPESVLAQATALLGKPEAALAGRYSRVGRGFVVQRTELSNHTGSLAVRFDEARVVDRLTIMIDAHDAVGAAKILQLATQWGPAVAGKNEFEENITTITVDGVTVVIKRFHDQSWAMELELTRASAPKPG